MNAKRFVVCLVALVLVAMLAPVAGAAGMTYSWRLDASYTRAGVAAFGANAIFGAEDGLLRCVDAATGAVVWSFDTRANGAGVEAGIRCRPAIYGAEGAERIFFSTSDGHLFCLDTSGKLIWHSDAPQVTPESTPAPNGCLLYVGGSNGVLGYWTTTGALICSANLGTRVSSSPSVPGTNLVWVGGENGNLYCLSQNLAVVRSVIKISDSPVVAPPSVDIWTRLLFVGTTGMSMNCVSATELSPKWSCPVDGEVRTGCWRNAGKLYFGTNAGSFCCLSQSTGAPLWKFDAVGAIMSSPVLYDGWAYFGTEAGFFYAVNTANPSDSASFESPQFAFTSSPAICDQGAAHCAVVAGTDGYLYGFPLK